MALPRAAEFDSSLAFLREGEGFVSRRCERLDTDAFRTRLMMRPVVCVRGPEAACMFYDGEHFTRQGAMPESVVRLLQDHGSVQSLDGPAHRDRKAMFTAMLMPTPARERLATRFEEEWTVARARWGQSREIRFLPEMTALLTRAACRWTGLPFDAAGGDSLIRELDAMVANAAALGPPNWIASFRRRRTERRLAGLVRLIRAGGLDLPSDAPARRVAEHRDPDGNRLSAEIAAVELLNLLRPIAAVGRFMAYAALSLDAHPDWRARFAEGDETMLEPFVEEVRRRYPFFPAIGGRVRKAFEWRGHRFEVGDWVVLDLHGTNNDPHRFPEPEALRPERAGSWRDQDCEFIPQGGGDARVTHRCPGEGATVELMKSCVRLLSRMDWALAEAPPHLRSRGFPREPRNGLALFVAPEAVRLEAPPREEPFRGVARNAR